MNSGFVHSVKVPRLYKISADILKKVQEDGGSLKTLLYEKKHPNVSGVYALTAKALLKKLILERLLVVTDILTKESRLNPWLARVLITELIWGKGSLTSECKPVQTIKAYEKDLRANLEVIKDQIEQLPTYTPIYETEIVKKPRYVRVNTIVASVDEILYRFENEGWTLLPKATSYEGYLKTLKNLEEPNFIQDFHIPEILVFPFRTSFYDHEAYHNGAIALQDKASCLPAFVLNPLPGSKVLDMCAAPGMKTTHIAAIMKNKGTLYATELESKRFQTLRELVEKMQCTCVQPMKMDALEFDQEQYGDIDYILVDPSCSGSGMSRHEPSDQFSPHRLRKLQSFQVFLLRHALLNFPTAKRVVYSTCSIREDENEEVVQEIMDNIGEAYRLVPVKEILGDNWINFSDTKYTCKDNCLYARSETDLTNGFFIAIFERNFDVPLPEYKKKGSKAERRVDPDALKLVEPLYRKRDSTTGEIIDNKESEYKKKKKRGKKRPNTTQETNDTETVEHKEENTDNKSSSIEKKLKKKKRKSETAESSAD